MAPEAPGVVEAGPFLAGGGRNPWDTRNCSNPWLDAILASWPLDSRVFMRL